MHARQSTQRTDTVKMLLFRVSHLRCALPVTSVREIVPIMHLSRPPGLPRLLAGFFVLESEVTPVVRLSYLLSVEDERPTLFTPLLVLHGAKPLALMVEAMIAMIDVSPNDVVPLDGHDITEGILDHDGSILSILAPDRLLLEAETACIDAWRTRESARLAELREEAA